MFANAQYGNIALSNDELKLLKAYREMNETDKEFIHMYINNLFYQNK